MVGSSEKSSTGGVMRKGKEIEIEEIMNTKNPQNNTQIPTSMINPCDTLQSQRDFMPFNQA